MTRFDRSFVDEMYEKYLQSGVYRWLAIPVLSLITATGYWLIAPKQLSWEKILVIVMFLLFAYQCLVAWLDYIIGNTLKLKDVIWRVDKV